MRQIEAIGFDLDGTLWNSTAPVLRAWQRICRKDPRVKKIPQESDIRGIMGLTLEEIARRLFPDLSLEQGMEILEECCEEERQEICRTGGQLFEGLEDTLRELSKEYPLYIVSNCHSGYIEAFLEYHRLGQYFCDHEDYGTTYLPKGENIRLVMERNHWKNSIYIGDTEGDHQAALTAGIPFIHAAYGFGQVQEASRRLQDIRELPGLLRSADFLAQSE